MLMSAIRQLLERWRVRRERIKRLNAARYMRGGTGTNYLEPPGGG
jgi:hypothetical protein